MEQPHACDHVNRQNPIGEYQELPQQDKSKCHVNGIAAKSKKRRLLLVYRDVLYQCRSENSDQTKQGSIILAIARRYKKRLQSTKLSLNGRIVVNLRWGNGMQRQIPDRNKKGQMAESRNPSCQFFRNSLLLFPFFSSSRLGSTPFQALVRLLMLRNIFA